MCDRQATRRAGRPSPSDDEFGGAAGPGEQAFAALVAEADVEVVALRAARGGAEHEAFVTADGAVEESLPFHVGAVACRQRFEVARHQPAQLSAVAQPEVLPQMVRPQAAARDDVGEAD